MGGEVPGDGPRRGHDTAAFMQDFTNCPSCRRLVRVPHSLLGFDVRCPLCGATFLGDVPPPVPPRWGARPAAAPAEADETTLAGDVDPSTPKPHRGVAILTMGLLSLVGVALGAVPGIVLGAMAWGMGSRDLMDMRQGLMDAEGEGMTRTGRTCGLVGMVLGIIGLVLFCMYFGVLASRIDG
jgi:hypothetical protein